MCQGLLKPLEWRPHLRPQERNACLSWTYCPKTVNSSGIIAEAKFGRRLAPNYMWDSALQDPRCILCKFQENLPWLIESTIRSTTVKMNEHFDPSIGVRRYSPFLVQSESNYQIKAAKVAVKGRISRAGIPFSSEERRDCPWSHEWSGNVLFDAMRISG